MKTTKNLLSAAVAVAMACGVASAQNYYEDDIYFNPSKDKDKNIEQFKKAEKKANAVIYRPVTADYPAADTYTVETSSNRDVDEYNRRGIFSSGTTATDSTQTTDDFENTRKIEKYYNPTIVTGSNDNELVELYYAEPAQVNIYVNGPGYWGWDYPYYSNYWGWSSLYWGGWYSPWWSPAWSWGWGPSWSWSWNWGPAWNWGGPGWGWGPSWGWGGPAWRPGWGGPSWGGGPAYNNPRHPGAGRQPAYGSGNTINRPTWSGGNTGRPTMNGTTNTGRRPGTVNNTGTSRPSTTQSTPNNNQQNNSYTRPGRNNSNPVYNNSNSGISGGNRTGGFTGGGNTGGSRSTGGGGGRGRH